MIPEKRPEKQSDANKENDNCAGAAKQQKWVIYGIYKNQDKAKILESIGRYVVEEGHGRLVKASVGLYFFGGW